MPDNASAVIHRFCALWAESMSKVTASLGIASPHSEPSEPLSAQAPTPQEFETLICLRFTAGGAVKGEFLWVAEKPVALRLAQLFKAEAANPGEGFSDAQREAFVGFLSRAGAETCSAWKTEFGSEIELDYQPSAEAAHVTAQSSTIQMIGDNLSELSLRIFLDEDLCAALTAVPLPATVQAAAPAPSPDVTSNPPKFEPSASAPAAPPPLEEVLPTVEQDDRPLPANLSLILDVELEATIRFGERHMLLRDVFGLMAGAVVELDQMVSEPAELLVAGRLVARGEVVVVDGNFGLRVTEVANVNDRVAAIPLR